jgi:hemerythrin-like domain-containing protein
MADQLLQQLAALHAEQHAPPVSLLLLSELSEVRALCRTLKEKITTLESLHEKRSREVHAAADSLELQLEGHIENLKSVMTRVSAVRRGAEGI